jgi:hypothetical protein
VIAVPSVSRMPCRRSTINGIGLYAAVSSGTLSPSRPAPNALHAISADLPFWIIKQLSDTAIVVTPMS